MESKGKSLALLVPCELAQDTRSELEKLQLWDSLYRLKKMENGLIAIPVMANIENEEKIKELWPDFSLSKIQLPLSKKQKVNLNTPAMKLKTDIQLMMQQYGISENLRHEVPTRWEKHGDLVIIPSTAFISPAWQEIGSVLWQNVSNSLSCKRLARHAAVADNGYRTSQVELLLGDNGIVTHTDNGIRYTYDVSKCMFSAGNITEKLRVANLKCKGETVVDLYAGIGYFTLPYLVHAKADHVHACEWNPDAVSALKNNLLVNGVLNRCTVHEGDNRLLQLPPVADRINLGLIPSSEQGWPVAVRVLKPRGGIMHIHGNVTVSPLGEGKLRQATKEGYARNSDEECESEISVFDKSHDSACNMKSEVKSSEKINHKCSKKHTFELAGDSVVFDFAGDVPEIVGVSEEEKIASKKLLHHNTDTECHSLVNIPHRDKYTNSEDVIWERDTADCASESDRGSVNVESSQVGAESSDEVKSHINRSAEQNSESRLPFNKSEKENIKLACGKWSEDVRGKIRSLLERIKGGQWFVQELHNEVVKSYAPHVIHAVLDLDCRPVL